MNELTKVREKRKTKEKAIKETGKIRWTGIGFFVSSMVYAWWYSWFYKGDDATIEQMSWVKKFFKYFCYFLIVAGIFGLIGAIYAIFVRYPRECEELKQLKKKEKQLEQEIEKQ